MTLGTDLHPQNVTIYKMPRINQNQMKYIFFKTMDIIYNSAILGELDQNTWKLHKAIKKLGQS